ncbi:hypothetical protein HZA97_03255 [Candidatus Woesearchaeota archaeon]|nr:hypothetical protein [Candidatus Woesearchaeota archaeon]
MIKKVHGWYIRSGLSFGAFLLVIGLFWLGQETGWLPANLSVWSILFVALGIYFIFHAVKHY